MRRLDDTGVGRRGGCFFKGWRTELAKNAEGGWGSPAAASVHFQGARVAATMPRLFTGLEVPEAVVGQLALMRGGVVGARWLEADDYHITLRFVGDVDVDVARDIDEILGDIHRS